MYDPLTYRYPRTMQELSWPCNADEAIACRSYRTPLLKRFFYAIVKHGWLVVPLVLALSLLAGGCTPAPAAEPQKVVA